MELKTYIIIAINDLLKSGAKGPVEFNLIVTPAYNKEHWILQVFGAAGDKDQAVSTIKFTINL